MSSVFGRRDHVNENPVGDSLEPFRSHILALFDAMRRHHEASKRLYEASVSEEVSMEAEQRYRDASDAKDAAWRLVERRQDSLYDAFVASKEAPNG